MKTDETIKFVTVGKLLQELEGYDEESREYSLVVCVIILFVGSGTLYYSKK